MYIDAQPVSLHARQAAAAAMAAAIIQSPTPQVRRPPAILNHSSSSSLQGMERTAPRTPPSFQSFVKRTPPVDHDKPLPPMPRSDALYSPTLKRTRNRASSVYSRTMSHWTGTPVSWRSRDLATTDMFLQSSVYSLSTPELVVEDEPRQSAVHTLLLPRAYQPLLQSPSSSPSQSYADSSVTPLTEVSSISFEAAFVDRRPSELLPLSQPTPKLSPSHVRTVSLDKPTQAEEHTVTFDMDHMKQNLNSKKALHKSRSMAGFGDMIMEELRTSTSPNPRATLYNEWQDDYELDEALPNIIQPSPWIEPSVIRFKLRESKLSDKFFGVDPIDRAAMAPIVRQQLPLRKSSILMDTYHDHSHEYHLTHASISSGQSSKHAREEFNEDYNDLPYGQMSGMPREQFSEEGYDHRGRARESSTATNIQNITSPSANDPRAVASPTNASLMFQADILAQEYHELLPRRTIFPAQTSVRSRRNSMDGQDIKMAPKPLFFNPRQVSKQRTEHYYRERNHSLLSSGMAAAHEKPGPEGRSRWRNPSPTPALPLKLTLTPDSTRASTSGNILNATTKIKTKPRGSSSDRIHDSVASGKKPSIFAKFSTASASVRSPLLPHLTRTSMDDNDSGNFFNSRAGMYAAEHVNPPKVKKEHRAKGEAPVPAVGATVVATRAEAEKAFQTPITPPGPSLSALSSKASAPKAQMRQPTLTSDLMASYAAPFGPNDMGLTTTKAKTKKGHKHKSSDSSTGSSNLTIRMFGSGVGDKVASVFHRRDNSNGGSISISKPAITATYTTGTSSSFQTDNGAPSAAAQSFLESIGTHLSSSSPPLQQSTKPPIMISAPIPILTTSEPKTSPKSPTNAPIAPCLFPPALPQHLPLPPSPNWPLPNLPAPPTPPSAMSPNSKSKSRDSRSKDSRHRDSRAEEKKTHLLRPGLLAHFTEMSAPGRRESKADRRREELKRSIRLVHGSAAGAEGASGERFGEGRGGGGAHNWL